MNVEEPPRLVPAPAEPEQPVNHYLRISATSLPAAAVVSPADFPRLGDTLWHMCSLLSHQIPGGDGIMWQEAPERIDVEHLPDIKLFDTTGRRQSYSCYVDGIAKDKHLDVNHRANAMINIGRFTDLDLTTVDDSHNQWLKEHFGSNHVYGDLVVVVREGTAPPDLSVYGSNPITSIMQHRSPSQEMIDRHGDYMAHALIQHDTVMDLTGYENKLHQRSFYVPYATHSTLT